MSIEQILFYQPMPQKPNQPQLRKRVKILAEYVWRFRQWSGSVQQSKELSELAVQSCGKSEKLHQQRCHGFSELQHEQSEYRFTVGSRLVQLRPSCLHQQTAERRRLRIQKIYSFTVRGGNPSFFIWGYYGSKQTNLY